LLVQTVSQRRSKNRPLGRSKTRPVCGGDKERGFQEALVISAVSGKDDPDAFAREIHKAGYATAPDYSTKLIELMQRHNLYRFDR